MGHKTVHLEGNFFHENFTKLSSLLAGFFVFGGFGKFWRGGNFEHGIKNNTFNLVHVYFHQQKTTLNIEISALHRLIQRNGWVIIRSSRSHYIYEKDGRRYPVPFYGVQEVNEGLRKRIAKEMDLK